MRLALLATATLALTGCAGSIQFLSEVDENDFPIFTTIDIAPGGSGQTTLEVMVEGSYKGTYEFVASATDPAIATPSLSTGTAELEDGVPFAVIVTVDIAATALATDNGNVYVEATDGKHTAGTTVTVDIYE